VNVAKIGSKAGIFLSGKGGGGKGERDRDRFGKVHTWNSRREFLFWKERWREIERKVRIGKIWFVIIKVPGNASSL
jgi:hypothetical protein